jgi:hypothetical protein
MGIEIHSKFQIRKFTHGACFASIIGDCSQHVVPNRRCDMG